VNAPTPGSLAALLNFLPSTAQRASQAEAFANPDRMAVLATLHGLAARSAREAVVVELGCGDGTNLLSLAALYPAARFVGLDGSRDAIVRARGDATRLGLINACFHPAAGPAAPDLVRDAAALELDSIDYLIALDVCSHLGRDAREAFFATLRGLLGPGGTAVLGFDTLPGATDFEPLRMLMRFHVKNVVDPAQAVRQARSILAWHIDRIFRLHGEGRVSVLRPLVAEVERMPDAQLLELLREEHYAPLSLAQFSSELEAVGLRWLTNARLDEARSSALPEPLREFARSGDAVRRQQYLDYFLMTRRRTSLVCRADEPITREASPEAFLAFSIAGRVARRHILAADAADGPLVVTSSIGETTLSEAATRLLRLLSEHVPAAVPVPDLLARAELARVPALIAIAELWRADVIELTLAPPTVAHSPPAFPRTGPLQQLRAAALLAESTAAGDGTVSLPSLWHRAWPLEGAELAALALLDGSIAREHFDPEVLRKLVHKAFILTET